MTTLTEVLAEDARKTYAALEGLVRRLSDGDLGWRPGQGDNWMTVGQLLMHCGSFGCGKAVRGFVTGEWPFEAAGEAADHLPAAAALPTVSRVQEALELLAEDRRLTFTGIAAAGEDDLLARRLVAPWGGRELSLFQHLLEMIQHLAQHKGQLFYYLKLMGRPVDSRDLWGASLLDGRGPGSRELG